MFKNKNDAKSYKFLFLGIITTSLLGIIIFIISLSLTIAFNDSSYIFAFLLCFFSTYLIIFLSWYIPNKTIDLASNKSSTKATGIMVGIIFFIKCILVVLPFLIGQIINVYICDTNHFIFNSWIMLATTFIYPITILIIQFFYINRINKL